MKLFVLLATMALLVLAYLVEGRSRYLAGLLANIPVKTLGVLLMVYAGGADALGLEQTARGAVMGSVATLLFLFAIMVALHIGWSFWPAIGVGLFVWFAVAYAGRWL